MDFWGLALQRMSYKIHNSLVYKMEIFHNINTCNVRDDSQISVRELRSAWVRQPVPSVRRVWGAWQDIPEHFLLCLILTFFIKLDPGWDLWLFLMAQQSKPCVRSLSLHSVAADGLASSSPSSQCHVPDRFTSRSITSSDAATSLQFQKLLELVKEIVDMLVKL